MSTISTNSTAAELVDAVNQKNGNTNTGISPLCVDDTEELYIGEFIQGGVAANGNYSEDNTSLVTRDLLAFPQKGLTLTVHVANGYKVALVYRVGSDSVSVVYSDYVTDGGTITAPSSELYYRVVVKKTNDSDTISLSEVPDIGLYITHKVTQAMWPIAAYANEQIGLVKTASGNGKLPLISHISDVHSDNVRTKRMLDFSDYIGVVCACITGDNTNENPSKGGVYWMGEFCAKAKSNVMVCGGNHDTVSATLNQVFKVAENKLGKHTGTEYYRDFPAAKLRIISYYPPTWNWGNTRGKDVEDFVCDALLSTPAGWGVLLMNHFPETWIKGELQNGADTTFYDGGANGLNWYTGYNMMVQKIVDAFIGGGTYGKVNTTGASVDFSQKAAGTKFVAYMTGHIHNDNILNLQDANWYAASNHPEDKPVHRQVMLNVGSGNVGMGGTNDAGGGKSISSYTQDAFNVYAIDLEKEEINVVRIGWDKPVNGVGTRKSMTISFAQTQENNEE